MITSPDPVDTVERFAELSATLDDPFAEEHEVLHAAGLDSQRWASIEARWLLQLQSNASDGTPDLAARFGQTYKATRERLAGANKAALGVPDTLPDGAGFLASEAQPWRAEAALVGREAAGESPPLVGAPRDAEPPSVADTLETGAPLPIPALPFQALEVPRSDGPDATLELGACLPVAALPFIQNRARQQADLGHHGHGSGPLPDGRGSGPLPDGRGSKTGPLPDGRGSQ